MEKKILDKAEQIQKKIHDEVDYVVKNSNVSVQDATNVSIYKYLAKLELMIERKKYEEVIYRSSL